MGRPNAPAPAYVYCRPSCSGWGRAACAFRNHLSNGINPDTFASWAYDALHVLAQAIRAAGNTDPEAIRKAILAIKGYQGVEGTYQFDENGDGRMATTW